MTMIVHPNREGLSQDGPRRTSNVLIVCGDGWSLFQDLERLSVMGGRGDVAAVNKAVWNLQCAPLHFVALDAECPANIEIAQMLPDWVETHHAHQSPNFKWSWSSPDLGYPGTSSLFAVRIGLAMGYKRFVLAGCPMDNGGNASLETTTSNHGRLLEPWFSLFRTGHSSLIRSLSGRTSMLFGAPDWRWFEI